MLEGEKRGNCIRAFRNEVTSDTKRKWGSSKRQHANINEGKYKWQAVKMLEREKRGNCMRIFRNRTERKRGSSSYRATIGIGN